MSSTQVKYFLTHLLFAIFIYQMVVTTYFIRINSISQVETSNDIEEDGKLTTNVILEEEVEHQECYFSFDPIFYLKKSRISIHTEINFSNTHIKICTPPPEFI